MQIKRAKIQLELRADELMVIDKVRLILEKFVNDSESNDIEELNDCIFEWCGTEYAIGSAIDTLTYLCEKAIVED